MARTLIQFLEGIEAENDPPAAAVIVLERPHLLRPHKPHLRPHQSRAARAAMKAEHARLHPHHHHDAPHPGRHHASHPGRHPEGVTPASESPQLAAQRNAAPATYPGSPAVADAKAGISPVSPMQPPPDLAMLRAGIKASQAASGIRPTPGHKPLILTDQDIHMIATVAQAEGASDHLQGLQATASVIINRMKSGRFGVNPAHRVPGDLQRLLEARNQFESVDKAGGLAALTAQRGGAPGRDAINATLGVASGRVRDPTHGSTYFQNLAITKRRGTEFDRGVAPSAVVGRQAFYDGYGGHRIGVPEMQVAYAGKHYASHFAGTGADAQVASASSVKGGAPKPVQVASLGM